MVGAKQFAIHRKVAPAKRVNPILAAISLPSLMRSHDSELYKPNAFKVKRNDFSLTKLFQNRPPVVRAPSPKVMEARKEAEMNRNQLISDELANLITSKVLKNIKSYLHPQREMTMGKHIKLEISL